MQIVQFEMGMYEEVYKIWEETGLSLGASDTEEQIKRSLEFSRDLFLVGKVDGKIIAVVLGAFDGRRGYVHHLAVKRNFQKRGYGKLMMEELHKNFKIKDVKKVHLFIEVDNEGVKEFYLRMGWHIRDDLRMMSYIPQRN
ncbi:MAG: GNAT family N-acetyltransferase [Candidatus Heimdallarchaeaceae archaeon]